jgi:hypothetical protein
LASGDPAHSSPIESITLQGHMPIRATGEARSRAHSLRMATSRHPA